MNCTGRFAVAALCVGLFSLAAGSAMAQQQHWGTIAYSPSTGAMGYTWDHVNEVDAEMEALSRCLQYAEDCTTAVNFHDSCGAIAVGENGGWGADWGYDDADAQFKALDRCNQYDTGCEVKRWQCSW